MLDTFEKRRLIFVTGKGGTGKSTFTSALGLALAGRGRSVLLAEVDSARPALESVFGRRPEFQPSPVAPGIEIANIDFLGALHAYLAEVVPVERVVQLILKNRIVQYFLQATPGARELVLLSRIHALVRGGRYDTLVVDLPASGHAYALFKTLESVRRLFQVGPLRKRGEEISETISDPHGTSLVLLTIPEEMSVNEVLETARHIGRLGFPPIEGILLNRDPGPRPSPRERRWLQAVRERGPRSARLALAADALGDLDAAAQRAEVARRRIEEETGRAPLSVPLLSGGEGLETARHLAGWLQGEGS
ncbi:ArsA family ATPase [Myxococcota bacterium]|nr:ArsA family ATPase [Myxococcota bacterium]